LAGLFMAIAIIFQKVIAVNNIPGLPFLRVSFGGLSVIIFSSILLGPWFGMLVGVGSDLLGYFVLDPNPFMWQITVFYAIIGFASYFIFNLIRLWTNKTKSGVFAMILFGILLILISLMIFFDIIPGIQLWAKIVILIAAVALTVLVFILDALFSKKKVQNVVENKTIVLTAFVIEILLFIVCGTLLKTFAFTQTYAQPFKTYFMPVLMCQLLVAFANIPMNIVLLNVLFKISKKYFVLEE